MKRYYSPGKILLTAEYAILKGAKGLALPTKMGQELTVEESQNNTIYWKSIDADGSTWLEIEVSLPNLKIINAFQTQFNEAEKLIQLIKIVKELKPQKFEKGVRIKTRLEFNRHWGLGSSSTLILNLSQWLEIDPYKLLKLTFGGSGYDIGVASRQKPITYKLLEEKPIIEEVEITFPFKENLYFIYLNKKMNSKKEVIQFLKKAKPLPLSDLKFFEELSSINKIESQQLFNKSLKLHEEKIATYLNRKPIQSTLFNDFKGQIKSLGAWGGDFILASSFETDTEAYFKSKGYHTIITYKNFILEK